jgi:predicted nucleic acid-binding protein
MTEDGFADTNLFVRFFTGDDPDQQAVVGAYFRDLATGDGSLYVLPSTLSEVVFVLRGRNYNYDHAELARTLDSILQLPLVVVDRPIVAHAVDLFRSVHKDWDDCLVAAYAMHYATGVVVSFDVKLGHIPGVTRIEP